MAIAGCPGQGLVPRGRLHLPAPPCSSVEHGSPQLAARWGTSQPLARRRTSPETDSSRARRCGMAGRRWHPAAAGGGVGGSGTVEEGTSEPEGGSQAGAGRETGDGAVAEADGKQPNEQLRRMAELFERLTNSAGEGEAQAQLASDELIALLRPDMRKRLVKAVFASSSTDPEQSRGLFEFADANKDGVIDTQEFAQFLESTRAANAEDASVRPLTSKELGQLFTRSAIGNIGFGVVDNSVMICAGDLIEVTLGTTFGISTLMAAGLGNAVSDIIGTVCREKIEEASALFMPDLSLSSYQMATRPARWAEMSGSCIGVTVGCLLGLTPLFIIEAYGRGSDASRGGDAAAGTGAGMSGPGGGGASTRTPTMVALLPGSPSTSAAAWDAHSGLQGLEVHGEGQAREFVGTLALDPVEGRDGAAATRRGATAERAGLSLSAARAGARGDSCGDSFEGGAHGAHSFSQRPATMASCAMVQGPLQPHGAAAVGATREMVTPLILIASAIMAGRRIWRILNRDRMGQPWDRQL